MKQAYTNTVVPRMMVGLTVKLTSGTAIVQTRGKIDTGADITGIPGALLHDLCATPAGEVEMRCAQDEKFQSTPTYFVEVSIDGTNYYYVEVVAMPRDFALVGLDLLNEYILCADGPAKTFELTLPA